MKNIKYIIFIIFATFGYSACTSIGLENSRNRTEAGKMVYQNVNNTLAEYIEVIDFAQKISAYIDAEDGEKDSIKYYLLPGYDILERSDNSILVRNYEWGYIQEEWLIKRDSKSSIATLNNRWEISDIKGYDNSYFVITSLSKPGVWDIEAVNFYDKNNYIISNVVMGVEMRSNNKLESNVITNTYSLELEVDENDEYKRGEIKPARSGDEFTAAYSIEKALFFNQGFIKGELGISVDRGSNYEKDNIKAVISSRGSVSITLRGVTEDWRF